MGILQLFADDLVAGQKFPGKKSTLSENMFRAFADLTGDAHPIHYDTDYASRTMFGKPVAHGLLLASLTACGATRFSQSLEGSMVALIHQSFDFLKPAFVGDTVESQFACDGSEPGRQEGIYKVAFSVILTNQHDDVLIRGRHVYLLRSRPHDRKRSVS